MLGKKVSRSLAYAACATDDKYWTIYQIRLDNNIDVGAHKPHMGGGMLERLLGRTYSLQNLNKMVKINTLCFPSQNNTHWSLYPLPKWPPSTFKSSPVTKPESSDARKSTALATSLTFNTTPFKLEFGSEIFSTCSASIPNASHDIGVATKEGDTQFTLIPCCPSCTLADRTRPSTACFAIQ
ncbi:hypothetical protein CFP56_013675 [Quercus suber]|uniref:Uncharacterized protein n=1 Tax=Quercus suber TaxID=58331 RepID=A0AAW0KUS5_QUESU